MSLNSISDFLNNPNKIDQAHEQHVNKLQAQGAEKSSVQYETAASISAMQLAKLNVSKTQETQI